MSCRSFYRSSVVVLWGSFPALGRGSLCSFERKVGVLIRGGVGGLTGPFRGLPEYSSDLGN